VSFSGPDGMWSAPQCGTGMRAREVGLRTEIQKCRSKEFVWRDVNTGIK
jgi:hypothetical protein